MMIGVGVARRSWPHRQGRRHTAQRDAGDSTPCLMRRCLQLLRAASSHRRWRWCCGVVECLPPASRRLHTHAVPCTWSGDVLRCAALSFSVMSLASSIDILRTLPRSAWAIPRVCMCVATGQTGRHREPITPAALPIDNVCRKTTSPTVKTLVRDSLRWACSLPDMCRFCFQ